MSTEAIWLIKAKNINTSSVCQLQSFKLPLSNIYFAIFSCLPTCGLVHSQMCLISSLNQSVSMRHWWLSSLSSSVTITIFKQGDASADQFNLCQTLSLNILHFKVLKTWRTKSSMWWDGSWNLQMIIFLLICNLSAWTYLYFVIYASREHSSISFLIPSLGNSLRLLSFCFLHIHFSWYLPLLQCSNSECSNVTGFELFTPSAPVYLLIWHTYTHTQTHTQNSLICGIAQKNTPPPNAYPSFECVWWLSA